VNDGKEEKTTDTRRIHGALPTNDRQQHNTRLHTETNMRIHRQRRSTTIREQPRTRRKAAIKVHQPLPRPLLIIPRARNR